MKKTIFAFFVMCFSIMGYSQNIQEPEFIGAVIAVWNDTSYLPTTKAFGELRSGTSWKYNSWNATSLYVDGVTAECKLSAGTNRFIAKVDDNKYDPTSILTVFRFDTKRGQRIAVLSLDNSGTIMASKTISDYKIMFEGKKYGESSYLIQVDLKPGEYGIVITQPDGVIGDHPIVCCFTVL